MKGRDSGSKSSMAKTEALWQGVRRQSQNPCEEYSASLKQKELGISTLERRNKRRCSLLTFRFTEEVGGGGKLGGRKSLEVKFFSSSPSFPLPFFPVG